MRMHLSGKNQMVHSYADDDLSIATHSACCCVKRQLERDIDDN